jgi:hypothetical protein
VGIYTVNAGGERLAFHILAYCLKFEEKIPLVVEDDTLVSIWRNAGMGIIECGYASCIFPNAFGDAILITHLLEDGRCV